MWGKGTPIFEKKENNNRAVGRKTPQQANPLIKIVFKINRAGFRDGPSVFFPGWKASLGPVGRRPTLESLFHRLEVILHGVKELIQAVEPPRQEFFPRRFFEGDQLRDKGVQDVFDRVRQFLVIAHGAENIHQVIKGNLLIDSVSTTARFQNFCKFGEMALESSFIKGEKANINLHVLAHNGSFEKR
jgi:hypothetical protein